MDKDRFDFYMKDLKSRFKKEILNAIDVYKLLGISSTTFKKYLQNGNLDAIPKFKTIKYKKNNGDIYTKYQFNLYDVAEFLAK